SFFFFFFFFFFFYSYVDHRDLHSFPTRRSSDLSICNSDILSATYVRIGQHTTWDIRLPVTNFWVPSITIAGVIFILRNSKNYKRDRKSTRLNSSHVAISYAVFCLKKKKKKKKKN